MNTFCDFHTHKEKLPSNVKAIYSAKLPGQNRYSSLQILPDEQIPEQIRLDDFCALGEIGLDRRLDVPVPDQEKMLVRLLNSARLYDKPVIIHCVRAYPELNRALKKFNGMVLLHRFQGSSAELCFQLKAGNRFISLSPAEVKQRQWTVEFFRNRPEFLKRLALESDDENVDYEAFYEDVAAKLNISIENLCGVMYDNFMEFINNGKRMDISTL